MSVWVWVSLAIAGFFAVSLLVGLAVAAVLANIGREFSRLIEFEPLGAAPRMHATESGSKTAEQPLAGRGASGARLG
jgi:hypothetical protein